MQQHCIKHFPSVKKGDFFIYIESKIYTKTIIYFSGVNTLILYSPRKVTSQKSLKTELLPKVSNKVFPDPDYQNFLRPRQNLLEAVLISLDSIHILLDQLIETEQSRECSLCLLTEMIWVFLLPQTELGLKPSPTGYRQLNNFIFICLQIIPSYI